MNEERKEILKRIISGDPLQFRALTGRMRQYKWDSPGLVVLRPRHITRYLSRYISDEISAGAVEEWADWIEVRDDIDYELKFEDSMAEIIAELANPELHGKLTLKRAEVIIKRLDKFF